MKLSFQIIFSLVGIIDLLGVVKGMTLAFCWLTFARIKVKIFRLIFRVERD